MHFYFANNEEKRKKKKSIYIPRAKLSILRSLCP